jgi:hypothetical protein
MLTTHYEVMKPMNLCRFQKSMTPEQAEIAEEFEKNIETEFCLCIQEIIRTNQASCIPNQSEVKAVDGANRDIDSIRSYWSNRLACLLDWVATKDYLFSEELNRRYLRTTRGVVRS